jgi:hypothetical protein
MKPNLFVLIFGGVGALLLLIAGILYFREQAFLSRAETVTGTVSDFEISSSDDSNSYCPVIDFRTRRGESVKYFANVCSSPPSFDIGEKVEVVYDPENIKHVQMNGFWSKYVGVFVLAAIGLPFFLIGAWGLLPGKAKAATSK